MFLKLLIIVGLGIAVIGYFGITFYKPSPLPNLVPSSPKVSKSPIPSVSPHYVPEALTLDRVFAKNHQWIATLSAEKVTTIIVTGDVIPARTVNYEATKRNNFTWPFEKTADFLKTGDITFIDLETPIIADCPLIREGFEFCGDAKHIAGLKLAGVDIATIANNHAGNFGKVGVDETAALLRDNDIQVVGLHQPQYIEMKGTTFAFLGYNDIGQAGGGLAQSDEEKITQEIKEARTNAEVVIVQYHWGTEYLAQPDDRQRYLGKFTIDAGADLVIGNHPHWIQPIQFYKDKVITYAHGNFVFDQEWSQKTKEGVVGKYTYYDKYLIDVEYFPIEIKDYGQPYFTAGDYKEQILDQMFRESIILSQTVAN